MVTAPPEEAGPVRGILYDLRAMILLERSLFARLIARTVVP